MNARFYSHGKLLLSGEYVVLDGARALALPTRPGQWLEVFETDQPGLLWESLEADGTCWLKARFVPEELGEMPPSGPFPADPTERLLRLLQTAADLQPAFLDQCRGVRVETRLEFPRAWGLGSSSTLLANLAAWSDTNPYTLLDRSLGGSGYDLACATSSGPIFYRRAPSTMPVVEHAPFDPPFAEYLWFVYLNVKQDSRQGIERYRGRRPVPERLLYEISELGHQMASAADLGAFGRAVERHERLIAKLLGLPPVQERLFPDYPGVLKSLGAWGGDFILAAGDAGTPDYFKHKGYATCLAYRDLIA